ncbi:hypothetical protein Tco_0023308 [Tanacetum coccineum]
MTYHPLRLKGLLFELEYDPLPNCTMRSSNSFEWRKIIFGMIASMGIRHAKTLTLRGKVFDETWTKIRLVQVNHPRSPSLSKFSRQDRECGIQFLESSLKIERPLVTSTVFAATTLENTSFAYRASTSANPNPMISPDFVEANYEVLESILRERQRQIHNEDL